MIPRKVELEGFLCYRDKQVIDLDGSDLWVLSGRNGSGKSTIFDAITYAVFGVHRGGSQGLENLVNTGASGFRIGFEFDLGLDRFRIMRSFRRGTSDRQLSRHELDDQGAEHWFPVPETDKQKGFDRWIKENVGLNYEMFTSSMMLRQGEAEKLLNAEPKQRFEIIAQVADLKTYQILHKNAETRRQERKNQLAGVRGELSRKPALEVAEIEAAVDQLTAAEGGRASAIAARDRLASMKGYALHWQQMSMESAKAFEEIGRLSKILEESSMIELGWNRLRDLDGVLPSLSQEWERRVKLAERKAAVSGLESEQESLVQQHEALSALEGDSKRRLAEICQEITEDVTRKGAIGNRLIALANPITRAKAAAGWGQKIKDLEELLTSYPTDLEVEASHLAEDVARSAEWKAALPTLELLTSSREELAGSRSRIETGNRALEMVVDNAQSALENLQAAQIELLSVTERKQESDRRVIEARTLFQSAQQLLTDLDQMKDLAACSRCGQPLTREHLAVESRRLLEERDAARENLEKAEESYKAVEATAIAGEAANLKADRKCRAAEADLANGRRELAQAEADSLRFEAACVKAFNNLDDSFRMAIAIEPVVDWMMTTFPTPGDLANGRKLRDGLTEAERRATSAKSRLQEMETDHFRVKEAKAFLDSIDMQPGDEEAIEEYDRLTVEADTLESCLKSHRLEKMSLEVSIDELEVRLNEIRAQIHLIQSRSTIEAALIEADREASAKARGAIPEAWLDAFDSVTLDRIELWAAERRSLNQRGVRELAEELPKAHWALDLAKKRLVELEACLAEVPQEARRGPVEIAESWKESTEILEAAEKESRIRQRDLDALRVRRDERAELEARVLEAERCLVVASKLAELLGRTSLQRNLIREAERGILDCANPILRDISGNDLELRLSSEDSDDDQALPLEVIDRTHGPGRRLGVAFLSGSQRFRVAVSLALGIGQYARGVDRPIQSVVIDEGFGCLDRQGRDEMIAQLSALKGRLARVVLVSHQEEFAEAFKDGYRFEIRDGSTFVLEFHR
jgi:DNA repair protein SbcC/Rad50